MRTMTMETLEEDLGDVDIEELESRLYSQVYHVNQDDQQCDLNASPNIVSKDEGRNIQVPDKLPESDNDQSLPTTRLEPAVDQDRGSQNVSAEINIVPAQSSSKKKRNSQKAKKRYFFRKNMTDDEFFSRSRKSLERVKQRARKYDKLISILREKQHQNTPSKINVVKTSEVITLSDSDGESCVEIPQPRPLVFVSDSEDEPQLAKIDIKQENKNVDLETDSKEDGDEDDVIIIENPKPEVICIDEDIVEELPAELSEDRELTKSAEKLGEQNSSCAPNEHQKEVNDTPESNTSNDFLETTTNVEVQNKFNFSLHGTDFNNRDFIKPANPCEVYETGSSCSTSDFNPPLKPVVFNEVEFPREDLFSEGNMENFGALITPKRGAAPKIGTKKSQTTSTQQSKSVSLTVNDSSGSSSESDYEETASSGGKTRKKLPNLSNMDGNDITSGSEVGSYSESTKKSKKQKNSKRKSDAKDTLDDKPKKRRKSTSVTENKSPDYCVEESSKNTSEKVLIESEASDGRNEPEDETQESKDNAEEIGQLDDFVVIDEINATVETSSIIDIDSENEALNDLEVDLQIVNCSPMKQTSKGTVTSTPEGFSRKNFSETWSPNKIEFYSRSIDISQCEVENFLSTMSDDPELWQISQVDKNPVVLKRIGPRCLKCRNFGHTIQTCPTGDIICSTCAGVGHLYNRCTRNICRQCGKRIRYRDRWCYKCLQYKNKFCKLCRVRGHIEDMCPDLWRRYYLTTKHGPLKKPEGRQMKPASQLWCSSCANSGHLENSCYKSEGPQSVMSIKSYEDIYSSRDQPGSEEPNSRTDASNPLFINPKERFDNPVPVNHSPVKASSINSSVSLPLLQQQTSQETSVLKNFQLQRTFNPQCIPPLALALYNLANYPAIAPVGITNVQQDTYNNVAQTLSHNIANFTSNIIRNNFGNQQSQDKQGNLHGKSFDHGNVGTDMSETRAYRIIISKPLHVVKDFIKNELIKLANLRCNAYVLRKKLSDFESLANNRSHDNLKECYREMNMLVFGVHRFKDGGRHLKTLRQLQGFKPNQRFDLPKRKMLWDSYNHIFGSTNHYSDYYNCLNSIIKEDNTAS